MASVTGLFQRGSIFYLRVVLPNNHPLKLRYKTGEYVSSLGRCSYREAVLRGTVKRAEILGSHLIAGLNKPEIAKPSPSGPVLRDIFDPWKASKPRSADTIESCLQAVKLYEEFTNNPQIAMLTRAQGDGFRAWLQHPDRKTTSKTARDRLLWVKSVLKHASLDLGVIERNPWEGLDIEFRTTNKRRPWTDAELKTFFTQEIYTAYKLPKDRLAGADAAYWIPLLGLYTGARVGELAQLRVVDVDTVGEIHSLSITDQGEGQCLSVAIADSAARQIDPLENSLLTPQMGDGRWVLRGVTSEESS